ncbi:hypothetical protein DL95DRAFT_77803 [Leptodontidium sp. 2 PMI_412]|nr:hypothetical protein DL95DRAFT_77803 [Leptodontidium sp. 2 PMI_412]
MTDSTSRFCVVWLSSIGCSACSSVKTSATEWRERVARTRFRYASTRLTTAFKKLSGGRQTLTPATETPYSGHSEVDLRIYSDIKIELPARKLVQMSLPCKPKLIRNAQNFL